MLEKKKFIRYNPEEDNKEDVIVVSLKLNLEEQALVKECKEVIQQSKTGTCIKSLVEIGAKVVLEQKTRHIIDIILKNKKNNKRTGAEAEFQ